MAPGHILLPSWAGKGALAGETPTSSPLPLHMPGAPFPISFYTHFWSIPTPSCVSGFVVAHINYAFQNQKNPTTTLWCDTSSTEVPVCRNLKGSRTSKAFPCIHCPNLQSLFPSPLPEPLSPPWLPPGLWHMKNHICLPSSLSAKAD